MISSTNARINVVHRAGQPQPSREAGYTLVELLIYSSLLVLVLTVVGGMLLNTLTSEQKILDSASANTVSQLISTSVHSGVRNGTALTVVNSADTANDDQLLVVTTVSSDAAAAASARVCQAWYYTEANGGAMYYKRGAAPQTIVAPTINALANDMTGWTLLGSGISASDNSAGIAQPVFDAAVSVSQRAVTLNFAINGGGDTSPAKISTTVTSRQGAAPATEPKCF
ncbi:hypothetical protein [Cryobacterium sp. PH29-G1]|uniref:hypothetical protein n=1 Tax=Cryobacterium sp. PH29-G1 TaxID=3046211 RepID=UPI0024B95F1C|nr:hypothetical protein [Cryobacterium sp. PH29-G1]MDJ0347748.1 hypothetical protein [Cryobacterium sp. PH29-G1]